jgi:hypothetical protein
LTRGGTFVNTNFTIVKDFLDWIAREILEENQLAALQRVVEYFAVLWGKRLSPSSTENAHSFHFFLGDCQVFSLKCCKDLSVRRQCCSSWEPLPSSTPRSSAMKYDLSRQTLGDLLRRTRQRSPNKLAIRCGEVDWTYAEFDNVCDRLASGLAARGVEIGDRVGVISRNSHAFVALRFALARLGAVLVPINFMLSPDEANYILQHSGAKLLCVDSGFAKLGGEASKGTDIRQTVWLPGEDKTDPLRRRCPPSLRAIPGRDRREDLATPSRFARKSASR